MNRTRSASWHFSNACNEDHTESERRGHYEIPRLLHKIHVAIEAMVVNSTLNNDPHELIHALTCVHNFTCHYQTRNLKQQRPTSYTYLNYIIHPSAELIMLCCVVCVYNMIESKDIQRMCKYEVYQ